MRIDKLNNITCNLSNIEENLDSALYNIRDIVNNIRDFDYKREYLKIVCNFLNNTKGYITDGELKELFNICNLNCDINNLDNYVEKCSELVECDEQDKFADFIFENGKRF